MPSIATRFPLTFGCRLFVSVILAHAITACDPGDEQDEALALQADEADAEVVDAAPEVGEGELPGPSTPGDEFAAAPREAVTAQAMWHFNWSQGQAPVLMRPFGDDVCFLTKVSGNFEGAGESVHVYQAGTYWALGGTSSQSGVSASATCISRIYWGQVLVVGPEEFWHQDEYYPRELGTAGGFVCLLTYVSGKFMGGGERVGTYVSNNRWYLGGASAQRDVMAGTRCLHTTTGVAGPYNWAIGQGPVQMPDTDGWACGLTRVQGKLAGAAESIVSYISGNHWYLGGTSNQAGVGGSAYCL